MEILADLKLRAGERTRPWARQLCLHPGRRIKCHFAGRNYVGAQIVCSEREFAHWRWDRRWYLFTGSVQPVISV